tara:strand:- start:2786 stop:3712 length:927 start_codon:yes stop_codon:yes gene_type:complete
MIKKIYFIVKPNGQKKIKSLKKVIFTEASKYNFEFKILNSTHKGHAILLARKSVDEKANAVIACGGDGTINEIAGVLMGKKIPLGIIPMGSGNGIAGHFNIPSNLSEAIKIIIKGYDVKIDVGNFNEKYFLGNLGFGFESTFIKHYNKKGLHGLYAYILAFFKAINSFNYPKLKVEWEGNFKELRPLVLLFSNLNQQGYNLTLTPNAKSNDGNFEMICIERTNIFKILKFLVFVFQRKEIKSKEIFRLSFSKMKISNLQDDAIEYEIDGEFFKTHKKSHEIRVFNEKLSLIVPENLFYNITKNKKALR